MYLVPKRKEIYEIVSLNFAHNTHVYVYAMFNFAFYFFSTFTLLCDSCPCVRVSVSGQECEWVRVSVNRIAP